MMACTERELLAAGWRKIGSGYRHIDGRELFRDDRTSRWRVRRGAELPKLAGRTLREAIAFVLPAEGPLLAGLEAHGKGGR